MDKSGTVLTEDNSTEGKLDTTLDQASKLSKKLNATIAKALRRTENGEVVDELEVYEEARESYQALLALLPGSKVEEPQLVFSPLDLMASYWERQAERKEMASTGFGQLDYALSGGLERDRLMILLGAPGSGKTTFTNQIADHVAQKRPVLYVSSEDTPLTLLAKTIARRATIDYNAVLRGYRDERDKIDAAFRAYAECPAAKNISYMDATQGVSLQAIAEQAERHFEAMKGSAQGDPVIVVDYLQRLCRAEDRLMRGAGGSLGMDSRQATTVYTERLREMACDLHCSVICLSAMTRQSGYNNASSTLISAAKESGDIEYTADVILAIGEQMEKDGPVTLPDPGLFAWCVTIAKNRQGLSSATGAHIELAWQPKFQRFAEREATENDYAPAESETQSKSNGRYRRTK